MRPAIRARLQRRRNLLGVAAESLSVEPVDVPGPFFIKSGYRHRYEPGYDDAFGTPDVVWQPRVYAAAAAAASSLGSTRVVDVGAGNGAKLAELHPSFELIGIDTGPNLGRARKQFPFVRWIEHDLDAGEGLGVDEDLLEDAVVVCADVIEHLKRPDALLASLRAALEHSACVVLSTPDRELLWGCRHDGPPPNPAHAREWSRRELAAFLAAYGFEHGRIALTQSRSGSPLENTILAVLGRDEQTLKVAFDAACAARPTSGFVLGGHAGFGAGAASIGSP